MEVKICTRCKAYKPLEQFSARSRNKTTGKQPQCKDCNALYEQENKERNAKRSKLYRERVRKQRRERQKIYRQKHRDKMVAYLRNYYAKNKVALLAKRNLKRDKIRPELREYSRRYAKENRPLMRALCSKRKAMQKRAIPLWVDLAAIKEFYKEAERLSKETGIVNQVDHIVPIRSKYVCGLHCQDNLQILTATQNNGKGNRVWPEMP